jgi:hypothetical protein
MLGGRCRSRLISLKNFVPFSAQALQRDSRYARVTDDDLRIFREIVGDTGVVTDAHDLKVYNR